MAASAYGETMQSLNGIWRALILGLVLGAAVPVPGFAAEESSRQKETARYEFREQHSRDGIGKFYLGREIAHVIGGTGAMNWLERPEREEEERTAKLVEALKLKPGEVVADVGAGTGYVSWQMAKQVADKGTVYAVEIQQEMIDRIAENMAARKITNVKGVLGTITDPKLPANAVDTVIMVDVYHEFSHPYEMMENICKALKPGGRVVFVEYRAEDPNVPMKELHKMSIAQVRKEMSAQPLEWSESIEVLPWQHIIIFKKRTNAKP